MVGKKRQRERQEKAEGKCQWARLRQMKESNQKGE